MRIEYMRMEDYAMAGQYFLKPDRDELNTLLTAIPGAAIADLAQTISASPTQAEVQAISTKVDAILASLRTLGLIN